MKPFFRVVALAVACMAPALCFAQSSHLTRQQVRDELAALEAVGYNPFTAAFHDQPAELQQAMAKVRLNRDVTMPNGDRDEPVQDREGAQSRKVN